MKFPVGIHLKYSVFDAPIITHDAEARGCVLTTARCRICTRSGSASTDRFLRGLRTVRSAGFSGVVRKVHTP
jgi:hypothetical protein